MMTALDVVGRGSLAKTDRLQGREDEFASADRPRRLAPVCQPETILRGRAV